MRCQRPRAGFTITETMIALGILGLALTLVAQVGVEAVRERGRAAERQALQELAANILESARARPWEDLTPEWAARQRLPEPFAGYGWRLEVGVEKEKSRPLAKRVTVVVRWPAGKGPSPGPVELVGLFAARSAGSKGGKP